MELWLYHRHHTLSRSQYIDFIGVLYRLILDPLTQNIVAQIQKCLELLFNTFPDLPLPLEQIARLIYYPNNLSLSLKCVQLTPVSSTQLATLQTQLAQHTLQIITGKNIIASDSSIICNLTALLRSVQLQQENDLQRFAVVIQLMDLSLHFDINRIDEYGSQLNELRLALVHLNNRRFREMKGYNWQVTKVKDLLVNLSSKITLLINAYSRTKAASLQSNLESFFSPCQNNKN
jgi:hypothetical protein